MQYVRKIYANKIEAMHESPLVSVEVEARSTSRLSSALFILPLFEPKTRQWKSILRQTPGVGPCRFIESFYCDYTLCKDIGRTPLSFKRQTTDTLETVNVTGHPRNVFCKISVRRSNIA